MSVDTKTVERAADDPTALPLFAALPSGSTSQARARLAGPVQKKPTSVWVAGGDDAAGGYAPGRAPAVPAALPQAPRGEVEICVADMDRIDWVEVKRLRGEISKRMGDSRGRKAADLGRLDRGETIPLVDEVLAERSSALIQDGGTLESREDEQLLRQAVIDSFFGMGRLQPLITDDSLENIEIIGADQVWLQDKTGERVPGPAVAESDDDLIELLGFLAHRSGGGAREFSESSPTLHLKLADGSRLAASAWICPRPTITIRRHRLVKVSLANLVESGMITEVMASFLAAAVKAKKSIVVAGSQGAGKTVVLRALCAEIPAEESVGTFETEYELHLHEYRPLTKAFEARPGTGEITPDGRRAGEYSIMQLIWDSFRHNLSRLIVGEVRGPEVMAMFKAMTSSSGSLSTTHAYNAASTTHKLANCLLEASPNLSEEYALRQVAEHIDLVVFVDLIHNADLLRGEKRRVVSEIAAIARGDGDEPISVEPVFKQTKRGWPGRPAPSLPYGYEELADFGFDRGAFIAGQEVLS